MSHASEKAGPTPIVSKVCVDGTLIETLYDAEQGTTALAVRPPNAATFIAQDLELPTGERVIPYSSRNNLLASGCVLLPSDLGDFGDKRELVETVQAFIHRYVDLSAGFEEIAAYYVLLSWVYDAFNELPYLRVRGDYGTGKTRALLTIGSICYKPFFASGASTVSPIFHILDAFGGTAVLDEADFRFSDATAELTKVLNNGTVAGIPVLRTMANRHRELNPKAFRVFGPKIVAMRGDFSDRALESRFLTEETGQRPLRPDISIHVPVKLKADALALRNRLLAWRFAALHQTKIRPARAVPGISPRLNQTALALLSIIDDERVRERLARELVGEEARMRSERASSLESTVLSALWEEARAAPATAISLRAVADRVSRKISGNLQVPITSRAVGFVVRTKLRLSTVKSNGNYVIPQAQRARIEALAERYGIPNDTEAVA